MATPAFKKFVQPEAARPGVITERDLDIITTILRYRFSPTSELSRLVGGHEDVNVKRLRKLWEWGYINRFAFPGIIRGRVASIEWLQVFHPTLHLFRREGGVNEHQPAEQFTNAARLVAVYDPSMSHAFRMEAQEIDVLGDYNTSSRSREGEVIPIGGPNKASVHRRRDINASMAEAIRKSRGDVLVQMKGNNHRSGRLF